MPAVSERQRRAMWAAAEGKSTLGIPKEVGKEFVGVDSAGVVYSTESGHHLLAKRGDKATDHAGHWAFPGGRIENDETARDAAAREFHEETGYKIDPTLLVHLGNSGNFAVFHHMGERFEPAGDGENSEFAWVDCDSMPSPMHPGAAPVFQHPEIMRVGANELQLARLISEGKIASPQLYGNVALFAVRITGTGVAYRSHNEQFAWRDPAEYLTPDFLQRCQGLPVIWEHPGAGTLDTDEFKDRSIGAIMLPYIKDNEVWGVAKILDMEAADEMVSSVHSTSPSVVTIGDGVLTLADGSDILIEGKPKLVDHLAICRQGVWDKGGDPKGVLNNHNEVPEMAGDNDTPAPKADADDKLNKLVDSMDTLMKRMDSFEEKFSKADADEKDDEDEKVDADEKDDEEEEMPAKADSDVSRRIADIESRLPAVLNDADLEKIADAQAKADGVYSAFGESAPRPLNGETPDRYRARLLSKLQRHSKVWAGVDLAKADASVLDIAEKAIHADALAAADQPATIGDNRLFARERRSPSGHIIREFVGDNSNYLATLASKPARVLGFNTGA